RGRRSGSRGPASSARCGPERRGSHRDGAPCARQAAAPRTPAGSSPRGRDGDRYRWWRCRRRPHPPHGCPRSCHIMCVGYPFSRSLSSYIQAVGRALSAGPKKIRTLFRGSGPCFPRAATLTGAACMGRCLLLTRFGGAIVLFLGNSSAFAGKATEVVELRAAHAATTHHLDAVHGRGIEREHAFHAFAEGELAHGEGGIDAAAVAGDAHAFEGLQALAGAFDHLHPHLQAVARCEIGNVLAPGYGRDFLGFKLFDHVHLTPSSTFSMPEPRPSCSIRSSRGPRPAEISLPQ